MTESTAAGQGSSIVLDRLPPVKTLRLEATQGIVTVWLNRPEQRNTLGPAMIDDLLAVSEALAEMDDVRAVVLRGRGGFFSAGGDLKGWGNVDGVAETSPDDDATARRHRRFGRLLERLSDMPQALIAVVEGAAMGGGFGLMTVADVVVARSDARLGMPEARIGLVPAQIAPFVVRRIGLAAARRLLVTGRPVDGRHGVHMGLVDHCCEAEADLEAALTTTLRDVLRCGPRAIALGKSLLASAETAACGDYLDQASREFAHQLANDEAREGIAAFLERRSPDWAGEI